MKTFSIAAILALAATIIANPIPEADAEANALSVEIEKRETPAFTLWTDVDFKGKRSYNPNPINLQCYSLAGSFNRAISSAGPTKGLVCSLWTEANCKGNHVVLRYPGSSNLEGVSFNDLARSWQCQY